MEFLTWRTMKIWVYATELGYIAYVSRETVYMPYTGCIVQFFCLMYMFPLLREN